MKAWKRPYVVIFKIMNVGFKRNLPRNHKLQRYTYSMVKQVFANSWPSSFSDSTLHSNQPDEMKGVTWFQWRRPDGTLRGSPTHHQHFSEVTQPGSGWAQGDNSEWGLVFAVKEVATKVRRRGNVLPLIPCNRGHTVTRWTTAKKTHWVQTGDGRKVRRWMVS